MTLERIEKKVDELIIGQSEIQRIIGTVVERSATNRNSIRTIHRLGLGILVALSVTLLSGCGLFTLPTRPPSPSPEPPKVDILARVLKTTVAIQSVTGFIFCAGVAAEGVFMTAAHCVDSGAPFDVLYRGSVYPGTVTFMFAEQDLAFIDAVGARVKDTIDMTTWAPQYGQRVIWTGYPAGDDLQMGTGIVASPDATWPGGKVTIYGGFVSGNSGGPVFDESGKLMGILDSYLEYDGHPRPLGHIVPPDAIKEALESL